MHRWERKNTMKGCIEAKDNDAMQQCSRFNSSFTLSKSLLGQGTFATVQRGHDKNNKSFAVKVVKKQYLNRKDLVGLEQEIDILKTLEHPNILSFHKVYDEDNCCYIVTEIMRGGDLYDRLSEKSFYPENDARDLCKILFETMKYCHEKKVAHRDLKPENILLLAIDSDVDVKIADFGFAKYAENDHSLLTTCGTPTYIAPEILRGLPYGTKVDMWSLGVVIYVLLCGYVPFYNSDQTQQSTLIRMGKLEFDEDYWCTISSHAKDLVSMLLKQNPGKRITAAEALESKWFHCTN